MWLNFSCWIHWKNITLYFHYYFSTNNKILQSWMQNFKVEQRFCHYLLGRKLQWRSGHIDGLQPVDLDDGDKAAGVGSRRRGQVVSDTGVFSGRLKQTLAQAGRQLAHALVHRTLFVCRVLVWRRCRGLVIFHLRQTPQTLQTPNSGPYFLGNIKSRVHD